MNVRVKFEISREVKQEDRYSQWPTLAVFDLATDADKAFAVFQEALTRLLKPDVLILPEALTAEEAERLREQWTERYKP